MPVTSKTYFVGLRTSFTNMEVISISILIGMPNKPITPRKIANELIAIKISLIKIVKVFDAMRTGVCS